MVRTSRGRLVMLLALVPLLVPLFAGPAAAAPAPRPGCPTPSPVAPEPPRGEGGTVVLVIPPRGCAVPSPAPGQPVSGGTAGRPGAGTGSGAGRGPAAGGKVPFTGDPLGALVLIGTALVGTGAGVVTAARRRAHRPRSTNVPGQYS